MANVDHQYDEIAVFELADDSVIAHSVTLQAESVAHQRLPEIAEIVSRRYSLIQVVDNLLPDGSVEALENPQRMGVVLNRPSQALSEPADS
jgi:hypothetical protein